MGKKQKKGKKGEASQYLTRSKAIRKLQLSLKDFRRLCILKGIYPREPKKKFEGSNKTYYHVKDLKILMHDKLLQRFREIKAHLKKYKRLLNKKEGRQAEEHLKNTPKYTDLMTNVLKERYPSFLDALKDLDDALCLISLFATFPQHQTLEIKKEDIRQCEELNKQFMLYCCMTQCFRKAFFSIKGIYYQVEIMGQTITWVAPYQFSQRLPFTIDYKVMMTFLEFYQVLLKFVNHKLFTDLGLDAKQALKEAYADKVHLDVKKLKELQELAKSKFDAHKPSSKSQISSEFQNTEEVKKLNKREASKHLQKDLFSKLSFLLNRETPTYCLQYLILSFGGALSFQEDPSTKITHHVMDRPLTSTGKLDSKREYVQPQWVVDSLNNLFLLPCQPYKPGVPPPPHLSPFTDGSHYVPDRQKEISALKGEELEESSEEDEEEQEEVKQEEEVKKAAKKVKGDEDSSSSDEEQEVSKKSKNEKLKLDLKKEKEELGKIMMSKKQRKLLEQTERSKLQLKQQAQKLKEKKKKLAQKKGVK